MYIILVFGHFKPYILHIEQIIDGIFYNMKALRTLYEQLGVEAYYKQYAAQYINPHLAQIQELLLANEGNLDYSSLLDLCAGGGEVSAIVQSLGYSNTTATDPFTHQLYQKNIGSECQKLSFDDIIRGKLEGNFSTVVCSFAMHLCPTQQLYPLLLQLFALSPVLVIISPHKRPILDVYEGVQCVLEDYSFTKKGKKVFLKAYNYAYIQHQ